MSIAVLEEGYLLRINAAERGVFVTTDKIRRDRFQDVAVSIASILAEN